MTLADIIDARAVLPAVKAQNKKQVLQEISQALGGLVATDQRVVFEILNRREKLGSTGLGQGIAIPHGRLPNITRVYGLFARLATPVDFDSVDGQPVDLVFALVAPDHAGADHLTALARISRLLREPATLAKLRGTDTAEGLYAILTEPAATQSAA
jgi:PTS system nitrogen regulatory IIA component